MASDAPARIITGRPTGPQVRVLMDKFGGLNRGDRLTKEQVASAIGESADSGRLRSVFPRFRERLCKERGIFLVAVPGIGWEAMPSGDEQYRYGLRRGTQGANRALRRGFSIADCVPDADLSADMRAARADLVRRASVLVSAVRDASKELRFALGTTTTNPKVSAPK